MDSETKQADAIALIRPRSTAEKKNQINFQPPHASWSNTKHYLYPQTFDSFFYHYGHNMITTGFREQQQKDPAPLKAFQHITNSPRQTWNH